MQSQRFDTFDELHKGMIELHKEVSGAPMHKNEEGDVLYFIACDNEEPENPLKKQVLCLAKLKTMEYHIFREIHTRLSRFLGGKKKTEEQIVE